jgi:hypothetical protein
MNAEFGHVECIGYTRYINFLRTAREDLFVGEENITMDVKVIQCKDVDSIQPAQDLVHGRLLY